ncbi:resuscitation-promoting factor [Glutamicibacter halophytocola]|uniref:LysM peptidoglycan-binding domain-containing protein n=1 Tax=Glutamicibacter halophytocola TaxID=1933880 RepID=A0ABX5YCP5_9MICC|nr:transglycosylase family protein [Glutamicibacter halophytocola]ALG28167.1 resuscitation-promoting factor [Glutamicibacter halophytocola]NQD41669.1 LysM peptidoglycan-binding domain-containing protein [Glutamicibacter halophytocola]QDY67437.1 LysM peptidoglycan-binding domain-containing protein [Glutamicibacter halophytocola]
MIQQKTKKLIRRGGASLAAVAVAGGAIVATTAPANAASTWDKLAQCESGGNWSINTGNGYYGGLQFSLSTWKAFGGSGMPNQASKAEQIRIATKVQASQGWGAWPACTAKLGISGTPTGGSSSDSSSSTQTKQAAPKVAETKKAAPKATQTKQAAPQVSESSNSVKSTKQAAPSTSGKHAAPAPQAPVFNIDVTDSGKNYTVKSGDTLAKIADQLGVDDWRGLFVLNDDQLTNPDLIMVGQTLNVPAN